MLAERFRHILNIDPVAIAIESPGRTSITWEKVGAIAKGCEAIMDAGGVPKHVWIGWGARNDPAMVGAAYGIIMSERSLAPFSPHQPAQLIAAEVRTQKPAAMIAPTRDWTPELIEAVRDVGAVGIKVDVDAATPAMVVPGLERANYATAPVSAGHAVVQRMSSGTTGTPKRILVNEKDLFSSLMAAAETKSATTDLKELKLQPSPTILLAPFAHSGGVWSLMMPMFHARTICLFERFTPETWIDAVKRYKPRVAALVPTMIKMVLDSNAKAEDLSSLLALRSSTAPLDPEIQDQFETRFNVPILIDYGASEFIGGITTWSLKEYKALGKAKRGSVGRPRSDVSVRIVSQEDGKELPAGEVGVLELKSPRFGADWIHTTDLASVDADGFLFIHGRSDEAIIRGGFKVLPEKLAETLRLHPGVWDACVLGIKDERLGAVPVAFIQPRPGQHPSAADLEAFLRERVPGYQIPVAFEFDEALPRTVSAKIARPQLRERYSSRYQFK